MKKILLTITALAALVACSKDEIVESQPAQAIGFSNIFIENSTRAAYDGSYNYDGNTGNLTQFHVYGTVTNANNETANIFNKQLVELKNSAWEYTPIQYWIPGNKYNFTAIADGNIEGATSVNTGANSMPTSITVADASKQKDILLAKSTQDIVGKAQGNEKVAFTFDHLMSKAKFTVQNSIPTEKYTYMVTDVKITNAASSATYDLATKGWGASSGTYELAFGDVVTTSTEIGTEAAWAADAIQPKGDSKESNFERLLIPTQAGEDTTTVTVSFDCELFYDGVSISKTEDKTATANVKLEPGHAYNFKIVLSAPGEPIEFTVTKINDWDYDINEDNTIEDKDDVTMQ
ncbi:MAG: fimbrillin family protein [Alistipes sp.]|nr:fimbrillin family protein [Alistipes sp.]